MQLRLCALGAVAMVSAVACAQPAAPVSTGPASPGSTPKAGGQLSTAINADPWDWDLSYTGKSVPNGDAMGLAYSSLLAYDVNPTVAYNDFALKPKLAERWEISPDAKSFTFYLRKGVKFANAAPVNGREVVASDVKWSYEYANRSGQFKDKKLPAGAFNWMFEGLESVDAPDPYKVVVRFASPFSPFIKYTASDWNPVLPKEIYDQYGDFKEHIVGSGPFVLDTQASQKGSRWVWKKNATYFEPGKPYLDEVRWLIIPDISTARAAFVTKQVDWLSKDWVDTSFAKELPGKVPNAVISKFNYPAGGWISFNVRKAPFNVPQVRQAFMLGVDRDGISSAVFGGVEPWALPGAFQGLFTQGETKALAKYDPEGAKKLLAQAGFANGVDMDFEITGNSNPVQELMQAQLKKVGINIRLVPTERAEYSSMRKSHKYNAQWVQWACASQLDDEDTQLYGCYYSTSAYNDGGIEDPALDRLILAQRAESDEGKRRELQRDAVKRITEMAWAGSLFYPTQYEAWQPALKNYAVHAASRTSQPWHEVWLEK